MAAFCVKHGYSGRGTPRRCSPGCAHAPAGCAGEALTEALRDAVLRP